MFRDYVRAVNLVTGGAGRRRSPLECHKPAAIPEICHRAAALGARRTHFARVAVHLRQPMRAGRGRVRSAIRSLFQVEISFQPA